MGRGILLGEITKGSCYHSIVRDEASIIPRQTQECSDLLFRLRWRCLLNSLDLCRLRFDQSTANHMSKVYTLSHCELAFASLSSMPRLLEST